MAQYYLSKNGQESGPFSQLQIDQMLLSGLFTGTELYRQDDVPEWKPITQLSGFVPPAVPPPVPPSMPAVQTHAKSNNCLIIGLVVGGVGLVLLLIMAMLAAIAVPGFLRARKRSQATRVLQDLRIIDSAIDQYAIEHNKKTGARVEWTDIKPYLGSNSHLSNSDGRDILGHPFAREFKVDTYPKVPAETCQALSDVAPPEFWSPYNTN